MPRKKTIRQVQRMFKEIGRKKLTAKHFKEFAQIAKLERQKGMDKGKDYQGKKFEKLKPETIRKKRNKGYSKAEIPLIAKGILYNPATVGESKRGRVLVPKSRDKISEYHQQGSGNNPKREHWGLYKSAIKRINKRFFQIVRKIIRQQVNLR